MQAELQEWLVLAPERLSTLRLSFPPPSAGVFPCVACLAAFTLRARSTPLRLRASRVWRKRSRQRGLDFSGEDMRALLLVGLVAGRATLLRRHDAHNDARVDHGPQPEGGPSCFAISSRAFSAPWYDPLAALRSARSWCRSARR